MSSDNACLIASVILAGILIIMSVVGIAWVMVLR